MPRNPYFATTLLGLLIGVLLLGNVLNTIWPLLPGAPVWPRLSAILLITIVLGSYLAWVLLWLRNEQTQGICKPELALRLLQHIEPRLIPAAGAMPHLRQNGDDAGWVIRHICGRDLCNQQAIDAYVSGLAEALYGFNLHNKARDKQLILPMLSAWNPQLLKDAVDIGFLHGLVIRRYLEENCT